MLRRHSPALIALVGFALLPTAVRADEWLAPRHDPQRTGASTGQLAIDRPAVVWRRYLGGQLASSQYLSMDVDGNGSQEVVYLAGGRAIAKRPDNIIAWESPLLGLAAITGIADLDADGAQDIVAYSATHVFALSSADGHVLWTNPDGPIGEVGAARVADLDGDHHLDLYIGECRCCTLHGSTNGVAYSFAAGYGAARQIWSLDSSVGGCGADADEIADVNGDGTSELVVSSRSDEVTVLNGATAVVLAQIPAPASGGFYPGTRVYPVNLDGDPANEMVVVTNGYLAASAIGARRVVVYDSVGSGFTALWEANAPDRTVDELSTVNGAIGDLDGDMVPEIAFTIVTGGVPHVEVRQALTGAMIAMLPGVRLFGAVDLDNDHQNELLVGDSDATMLAAYHLAGGALVQRWVLPGRRAVTILDHSRWVSDAIADGVLALNLDADPALELIVASSDNAGPATLFALNADTNPPTEIGHFPAPAGITLLTSAIGQNVTQPYPQVLTVTSDGYLIVLDRTMQPTNRITEGEIQLPGMRVGGYYSGPYGIGPTPSIAHLDTPAVLVRDSRPALLRLDVSSATLSTSPPVVWERPRAQWPVIADVDGDGMRDLVVDEGNDIVNLDPATATHERWRAHNAAIGGLWGDLLPAHRGAGNDIYFPRVLPGATLQAVALNGADGSVRWSGFTRALQWGFQSYSVGDLTGDGIDDLVSVTNSTHVLNGADGTLQSDNSTFVAYAMPMQTDANGDGITDVWVHGGYYPDRLLTRTMTDVVIRSDRTAPNTGRYGARVTCAGAAAVVESGYGSADLWTVRLSDATSIAHRTLASGDVFDIGMVLSDHAIGQVGNATAVADIGSGHPAVLAGSTDGFLYALDPCTLSRIWSLDLRYPVGEVVVGDTNGAAPDEMVVTCADGFLYGIGRAAYNAPDPVLDTDPNGGHPDTDVDEIDTVDTLWAKWSPVAGATSYEVAVYSAAGTETRFPNFSNVGNVTATQIDMLPLRQGARFYVSVRPIGPNGPGLEGRSNGVMITDNLPPTATVSVSPTRAWPPAGNPPFVIANCADRVGLAHYRIEVQRADGTLVVSLDDRDYTGLSHEVHIPWDGLDASGAMQPAGAYNAHVSCRDLHMRETTADATFTLDPTAILPPDAGPSHDGGMDGGTGHPASGCACRTSQPARRSHGASLALFALVAIAIARRRSRSTS